MTKRPALELKIRDAAISVSKVNAAHKQVYKKSCEEKDAEIEELHAHMDRAQEAWEEERQVVEDEKVEHLAQVCS